MPKNIVVTPPDAYTLCPRRCKADRAAGDKCINAVIYRVQNRAFKQSADIVLVAGKPPVTCEKASFVHYESSPTSSRIEYIPAGLPSMNDAARSAPEAKTSRLIASCESVITSSAPAKITSCLPQIVPPRTE